MGEMPDQPDVADALKAVAFISGLPLDQVGGYVLIVIIPDGTRMVTSSLCCRPHINATMADVVADTAMEIADTQVHVVIT